MVTFRSREKYDLVIFKERTLVMKQYPVKYQNLENGEVMAYRECGDISKKTLVLVHGNQSSSVFFQNTMEALESDAHIVAVDLIGFGDSSYNRTINTLQEFSIDIALFLKAKNLKNIYVLGWSTGGGIVMELAVDHPELISHIILLDSVGSQGYPLYKLDTQNRPILSQRIYKREDVALEPVQVMPIQKALEEKDKAALKKGFDAGLYNLKCPPKEEYDIYLDAIVKERCIIDVDTALASFNITHEFNGAVTGSGRIDFVKCPVTVLHGKKDLVVPVEEAIKTDKLLGERSDLILLSNAGHALLNDRPKAFYEVLRIALSETKALK
ncbi:MAG: alpha/beta hydrolase [Clostridia bacterium]|nr:alpha/beta hydrolase [Clostridia bacterium]